MNDWFWPNNVWDTSGGLIDEMFLILELDSHTPPCIALRLIKSLDSEGRETMTKPASFPPISTPYWTKNRSLLRKLTAGVQTCNPQAFFLKIVGKSTARRSMPSLKLALWNYTQHTNDRHSKTLDGLNDDKKSFNSERLYGFRANRGI